MTRKIKHSNKKTKRIKPKRKITRRYKKGGKKINCESKCKNKFLKEITQDKRYKGFEYLFSLFKIKKDILEEETKKVLENYQSLEKTALDIKEKTLKSNDNLTREAYERHFTISEMKFQEIIMVSFRIIIQTMIVIYKKKY